MFEKIKSIAPNIPDEVIKLWLLPFAEVDGLPTDSNRWDTRKSGEKIEFWNDAIWEKKSLDLSKIDYSRMYFDAMRGLHEAYIQGIQNSYSTHLGEDGKKRFRAAFTYIAKNGKFPQPPIMALDELGKYQLLDGNHRFLGFIKVEHSYIAYDRLSPDEKKDFLTKAKLESFERPNPIQEIWLCSPNWKNSENARIRNYLRDGGLDIDEL